MKFYTEYYKKSVENGSEMPEVAYNSAMVRDTSKTSSNLSSEEYR